MLREHAVDSVTGRRLFSIDISSTGDLPRLEAYERRLGRFVIRLSPDTNQSATSTGWHIGVFEPGRLDDLSQFTIPFAGPNARYLFAWFDPNGALLNLPGSHRTFFFSPDVGRSILWDDDAEKRRLNVDRIYSYGRGDLDVLEYRVGPAAKDDVVPPFTWIRFAGCLTWAASQ